MAFGQFQPPALPGLFLFFLHHLSHVLGRPERRELQELPTPPPTPAHLPPHPPQLPSAPRGAFLPLKGVWGSVLVGRRIHSGRCCRWPSSGRRRPPGSLPLAPSRGSGGVLGHDRQDLLSSLSFSPATPSQKPFSTPRPGQRGLYEPQGPQTQDCPPSLFLDLRFPGTRFGRRRCPRSPHQTRLLLPVWLISRPPPEGGIFLLLFLALSVTVARAKNSLRTLPVISLALEAPLPKELLRGGLQHAMTLIPA